MCVSLFESFCIILSIDSDSQKIQLLLNQILQAEVEQKQGEKEVDHTHQRIEPKFVSEPTIGEKAETKEKLHLTAALARFDPVPKESALYEASDLAETYQLKYDIKEEREENELQDKTELERRH